MVRRPKHSILILDTHKILQQSYAGMHILLFKFSYISLIMIRLFFNDFSIKPTLSNGDWDQWTQLRDHTFYINMYAGMHYGVLATCKAI